jgi:3'(2'), 5'-bisphosphate nucleotidase
MLEKELEVSIILARLAGDLIMDFYAKGVETEQKLGVDNFAEPVTIADRASSRLIVEGLAKAFPEDGILSEEEKDVIEIRAAKSRVWMIDPIDGTQGFINKDGDFGVQIGLTENGEAILGIVFLPAENTLYYASKNAGTFLVKNNAAPIKLQVSDKADLSQMTLVASRNHRSPKMRRIVETLGLKREIQRGSVGLKVGQIAERKADLYVHLSPRTKYWDTCAPQVILEEAGGEMSDLFGTPLRYDSRDVQNHNGIVATNGAAHETVISGLKSLLNEFGRFKIQSKFK